MRETLAAGRNGRILIRIPLGRPRLGIGDLPMMDGLSCARGGDKSLRPLELMADCWLLKSEG